VPEILESVQETLYDRARNKTADFTVEVADFDEFQQAIREGKRCLVPWAESEESEEEIKEKTGAKSSCIPFNCLERFLEGVNCFYSGKPATCWAYFAKSH
jgi:prolyl-tRNA synthetase